MLEILCIIVFIGALLGMIFFQCSYFMGCVAAAAALGLFIAGRFVLKNGRPKKILTVIFSAGLLCLCFAVPVRTGSWGALDYQKQTGKLIDLQINGKSKEAAEQYEMLAEKYGEDDQLLFVKAQSELDRGDLADAQNTVASFRNKHSRLYYSANEQLIAEQYRTDGELSEKLLSLYMSACKDDPKWWYPARNAGGLLYDQGRYSEAAYYLGRAYIYDEHPDGATAYYLGSCFMELGNRENGIPLMIQALDLGVDETIESHISWYLNSAANEEGEQDEEISS